MLVYDFATCQAALTTLTRKDNAVAHVAARDRFRDQPGWGFVDWVLRGIGQVVFQNNPDLRCRDSRRYLLQFLDLRHRLPVRHRHQYRDRASL